MPAAALIGAIIIDRAAFAFSAELTENSSRLVELRDFLEPAAKRTAAAGLHSRSWIAVSVAVCNAASVMAAPLVCTAGSITTFGATLVATASESMRVFCAHL